MYHSDIELKEGAFVVSDAHYSHIRPEFLDFLKAIYTKQLNPTQLILMGDIFDTLFGNVAYTQEINSQAVEILNDISQRIEVVYLEGNHDFNLKKVFPHVKVFGIKKQPVEVKYNDERVLLAHGDIESPALYNIYTATIRNPFVITLLSIVDSITNHSIINRLDEYLSKKEDCKEFTNLKEFMSKRLDNKYDCDYFIEGHFHQNKTLTLKDFIYINLGAFACNQRYFIVKSSKELELLQEKSFS